MLKKIVEISWSWKKSEEMVLSQDIKRYSPMLFTVLFLPEEIFESFWMKQESYDCLERWNIFIWWIQKFCPQNRQTKIFNEFLWKPFFSSERNCPTKLWWTGHSCWARSHIKPLFSLFWGWEGFKTFKRLFPQLSQRNSNKVK